MASLVKGPKVRFGIVGMGFMGKGHARGIVEDKNRDFTLAAVADVVEPAAKAAGEEFSVPHFVEPKEMFKSGLIDAAIIATPHCWHPVQTMQAIRAGVHVLCEKPLAVTIGPARVMVAEAQKAGIALGSMLQYRTRSIYRKMKDMIDSGKLGDIYRVSMTCTGWYRTQAYYDSGAWRGTWDAEGGGILLNQAPHHLDIFQWLAGMPKAVLAFTSTRLHKIEVENTAQVVCKYDGGKIGTFYASTAELPGSEQIMVVGDKGTLLADGGTLRFGRLSAPISKDIFSNTESRADFIKQPQVKWDGVKLAKDPSNPRMNVIRAFAAHLLRGEPMVATAKEGLNELELSNAAYESDYMRKSVPLPVRARTFEGIINRIESERTLGKGQDQRRIAEGAFRLMMMEEKARLWRAKRKLEKERLARLGR